MTSEYAGLDPAELDISYFKASGPGGQKRNKCETAVRVLHRPSGIIVTATESRSQVLNRQKALERMAQRLEARTRRPKPRRATRPTKSSQKRRVAEKKRRGTVKSGRSYRPGRDD